MRIKLFILFVSTVGFFQSRLLAQNENALWYIGGKNWVMDFSDDTMHTYEINRDLNMGLDNSSICNLSGQMFCYSNNTTVLNAEHDTILGKQNVCYSDDYNAVYQNSIFLPSSDSNLVFFFGYCDLVNAPPVNFRSSGMSYSVLDKRLNNNMGGIYDGLSNVLAINDTLVCNNLTACKHANGKDWWVLTKEFYGDIFYRFLTSPSGIVGSLEQHIGPDNYTDNCACQSVFSPDGSTYIFSGFGALVYIYDFDRCTGELSNERWISTGATWGAMGVAVSPNNGYLYISAQFSDHPFSRLFQYDLKSANINQSKITIASSGDDTSGVVEFQSSQFGNLQLGPDNKIYVAGWGGSAIHVIDRPDSFGLACNFQYKEYTFDTFLSGIASFPNQPNYSLGPLPVYQFSAGNNKTIIKGDTAQIGSANVAGLLYSWQPALNISSQIIAQPFVFPDTTTTYVLTVTDTSGEYSCSVRQDSVTIFVTPQNEPELPIIIPTLINVSQTGHFKILNLPEGNHKLEIFNYLGQVVYASENYLNNWKIKNASAGLYLYRLTLASGVVMKGKIVIVR